MTDLHRLIEAVEGGAIPPHDLDPFVAALGMNTQANDAHMAYRGSIDAAKALHEALFPGVTVKITDTGAECEDTERWFAKVNWQHMEWQPTFTAPGPFGHTSKAGNPARAWLIAILKAYEAQQ